MNRQRREPSTQYPWQNPWRFLRTALVTPLALCLVLASIVYVLDPFYHYHKPWFGLPAVLTEKEYQVVGSLRHFDYDAVLAGSSVVENNDNSWFDKAFSCKTVKAVRSYGGIADLCWFLDEAFDHQDVKKVFFNLDPASLTQEPETTFKATGCPMYLYDSNPFNDISYLLNGTVLFEKIPYMLAQALSGYNENLSYNWADGKDFSQSGALSHYLRHKESVKAKPVKAYAQQNEGNIRLLTEMVKAHPDTEFFFFLPPYSELWWDNAQREGMTDVYLQGDREAVRALLSYSNVRVFDFQNEEQVVTNLNLYMDTVHFSPEINHWMVTQMAAGQYEVTKDNCSQVFEATEKLAKKTVPERMKALEKESALTYEQ